MSVHRDEHLELCAGLALGVLDDADRREMEQHLAEGCPVCEAELTRFAGTIEQLATLAPPRTPPAALKRQVLDAALAARPARDAAVRTAPDATVRPASPAPDRPARVIELPRRRSPVLTWAWAVAAALLAVANLVTQRDVTHLRDDLARTGRQLADAQHLLAVVTAPDARVVDMTLTPDGAAALKARATFDPHSHRAVIVLANATPPTGKDYQLWVIGPNGPSSLGLVHADVNGQALASIEDAGDPSQVQAFAVSLEAAGGSPDPHAPKGPVVMVGKL